MSPTTPRANRRAFARYLREAIDAKYGPRAPATRLAQEAGLSDQTISRWLNEGADPTPDKLRQLAPALGVTLAELLAIAEIVPADELPANANPAAPLWAAFVNEQLETRAATAAEFAKLLDRPATLTPRVVALWTEGKAVPDANDTIHVAVALGQPASRVLRFAGHGDLAAYIDEVAGTTASDAGALEQLVARVRAITDGLTPEQRSALEQEFLEQIGNSYLLAETKATRLRRATEEENRRRGAS